MGKSIWNSREEAATKKGRYIVQRRHEEYGDVWWEDMERHKDGMIAIGTARLRAAGEGGEWRVYDVNG